MERTLEVLEFDKVRQAVAECAASDLGQAQIAAAPVRTTSVEVRLDYERVAEMLELFGSADRPPMDGFSNVRAALNRVETPGAFLEPPDHLLRLDHRDVGVVRAVQHDGRRHDLVDRVNRREVTQQRLLGLRVAILLRGDRRHPRLGVGEEGREVDHAEEVGVHGAVPVLEPETLHRPGHDDPRVVDEHVDTAVAGQDRSGQPLDRGPLGAVHHVMLDRTTGVIDLGGHRRGAITDHVDRVHPGSLAGEEQRRGPADPGSGPGDHRCLAVELAHRSIRG